MKKSTTPKKTPYEILGIPQGAAKEEVRKAYKELSLK